MYAVSVGVEFSSCVREDTDTSVWVADGGRERSTVRKVSWRRTACQSLRRDCLSTLGELVWILKGAG